MTMQQISSPPAVNDEVRVNENFETVEYASVYGKRHPATTGLTWGYYGGRWSGYSVSDGTLTLTASSTNYVVVLRSSGVISTSTSSTNWNNTGVYARVYQIVTGTTTVSSVRDHRGGLYGVHGQVPTDTPGAQRRTVTALSISSGVVAVDAGLGDYFTLALNANVTSITFSNLPGSGFGTSLLLRITQDSTPRTVAWPASFRWANGSAGAVSVGSGAVDFLAITTFDNGTTWVATLAPAFA